MAAIQPLTMAGREEEMEMVPCFHRKMLDMTADGIKKSRTMPLAVKESIPRTKVSQRINRLPPPIPRPVKNPNSIAINKFIAKGIGHLPR